MAHRKSLPSTQEWINSLNLIDVVYGSHPTVVAKWHDLYANYSQKTPDFQQRVHLQLEMLAAMAQVVGYNMSVTDIDKFYTPQSQVDQQTATEELQKELLRVLKASESFGGTPKPTDGPHLLPATTKTAFGPGEKREG